jgi:transcriptional regulator with XRE-family HTH domain
VGLLLREWRDRRGLSLHQLAEKAGVSYVTISRIENGRMSPTVALLEKLAAAMDLSLRDLFSDEKARRPRKEGKR